jgi:predicted nucleic acid-binding protein
MKRITVYLDNCCYNRPFDDQTQIVIQFETIAKLFIQSLIQEKKLDLVWSFILDYEIRDNPFAERKMKIQEWENLAAVNCGYSDEADAKAQELMARGIRHKDSLHIACAVVSRADYFITTDRHLLNKNITEIIVLTPTDFVRRYIDDNGK